MSPFLPKMKPYFFSTRAFVAAALLALSPISLATSNYEYGKDEYVTVSHGLSPDKKLAITAHGEGELGDEDFHLYLFDAGTGKKIGPLSEIDEFLDTGAGAFAAKWSADSTEVTLIYRVDRHEPLKSITYKIKDGRATPTTKKPVDVAEKSALVKFWQDNSSDPKPTEKTFGTPKKKE